MTDYDVLIIGGGINGCGIARDAAGRGLSVLLAEARDLGSATSSASTKLIHGGLRYLEHREFKLVKESLKEREVLLAAAPHIIRPMDFVLPYDKTMRPAWMIRLGLFLYDRLSERKKIKASGQIDFTTHPLGDFVRADYRTGFTYQDCWADDARLVVLNALSAREYGATILTYTAVVGLTPVPDKKVWHVTLQKQDGQTIEVMARTVINAAGPWVRSVLDHTGLNAGAPQVRLSKGSHIIVPRLHPGEESFILQQPDGRIVFAIPYEHHFTLIGTTDVPYDGDPAAAAISPAEAEYLIAAVNRAFTVSLTIQDIVWSYAGVRPLLDDGKTNISKVTRDYKLHLDLSPGAPILSVFGGKLTTYRHLAEQAVSTIAPKTGRWTAGHPLPGGEIVGGDFAAFINTCKRRYDFLDPVLVTRYARAYGARVDKFLKGAASPADLGRHFGDGIFEAELVYLIAHEFARTVEDVLWRRSKLGLHISKSTLSALERDFPSLREEVLSHVQNYTRD